ncbi:MAG: 3-dehydroquinate synthase [Bacteroidia bacterium]|nr:3-dehydroquinate synthase [Bacteroidia bacterium]
MIKKTPVSNIIVSDTILEDISSCIKETGSKGIFILVDENTEKKCLPVIANAFEKNTLKIIKTKSGEKNKTLKTLAGIWQVLTKRGADRDSLLINLGGGVICDMGGFAASAFKRGIRFINIPTTLLAQVDASIGGKTGINFLNLKNEIGVFRHPEAVLIYTGFLKTLDKNNFLSGMAEILKHALIFDSRHWDEIKGLRIEKINSSKLKKIISLSVAIKNHFVNNDPFEKDIRKALNFGHTAGHAFESFSIARGKPVSHGNAVAAGMIMESYLSYVKTGLPLKKLPEIKKTILSTFTPPSFSRENYKELFALMKCDKKNLNEKVNFTLLHDIGSYKINNFCTKQEIYKALDFTITGK